MNVDGSEVLHEINDQEKLFTTFGDHQPSVMELECLKQLRWLFHPPNAWDFFPVELRIIPEFCEILCTILGIKKSVVQL
jgi:hypothetical protein